MILLRIFFNFVTENIPSQIPYHLVVWIISGVMTIIPYSMGHFGAHFTGCWIKNKQSLMQMMCMTLPVLFCMVTSVVLVCLIMYYKRKWIRQYTHHLPTVARKKKEIRFELLLIVYTLGFMLFWIPPVIIKVLFYFNIRNESLVLLDAISLSLQGCATAVVWTCLSTSLQSAPIHSSINSDYSN